MDIQQLFKGNKEVECPLCTNTLNNPRTLPCHHSFCLGCLDKRANFARRQRQHAIECSVCQTSLQIPETDTFVNLPSPIHVNRPGEVLTLEKGTLKVQKCSSCDENNPLTSYCLVCQSFVCSSCSHSHHCFDATSNVVIDKPQNQDVQQLIERPFMCPKQYHENQPLEFYCEDCKVLICFKCSVVSHNRHLVIDTQKAAQEQKMQMAEAVAKVKAEIHVYENEIKKQKELRSKNITNVMNAEKNMTDTVEELIRDLREHEKKMKNKFRDIYEAEEKQHATRLENLELITTQLKSFVEKGQGILARNISAEILQTNPGILGRCDELLNARKTDVYKSPYLNYLVDKKLDLLDRIVVTKTDPSMCLTKGHDSEIGKESDFFVVTRDSEGLQHYVQDDEIKVDILTPEGDHLRTELKDSKDGKYTVTYTPQCAGQHRVEVQVNGQLLTGSPCVVEVRHPYYFAFKFGSRGNRAREFVSISDIAVSDQNGTIAVADNFFKRIQMYSSDGTFQRQVTLDGPPYSLAFTNRGDLLTLLSRSNNKLRLFSEEGQFIKNINDKHLKKPQHLSITSDGRLIITDSANNEVMVLSPVGNDLLLSFIAPDCAAYPEYAVYHLDNFFVSYPGAGCVKVFDKTGKYLHNIGCQGLDDGQFDCPHGLVIDKYSVLIVCDVHNKRLQRFTLGGKFLSKLQGEYFNNDRPYNVTINNNDKNLFVAGLDNVYVFH